MKDFIDLIKFLIQAIIYVFVVCIAAIFLVGAIFVWMFFAFFIVIADWVCSFFNKLKRAR